MWTGCRNLQGNSLEGTGVERHEGIYLLSKKCPISLGVQRLAPWNPNQNNLFKIIKKKNIKNISYSLKEKKRKEKNFQRELKLCHIIKFEFTQTHQEPATHQKLQKWNRNTFCWADTNDVGFIICFFHLNMGLMWMRLTCNGVTKTKRSTANLSFPVYRLCQKSHK